MSRRETVFLISRAFSVLLLAWLVTDATYLPEYILSLSHHIHQSSVLATRDYWTTHYATALAMLLLRMAAITVAAVVFWRCGESVQRLFSDKSGRPVIAPGTEPQS